MPDISVVVPTYSRTAVTVRAIESVLAQRVNLEVIVVDDGSPEPFVWRADDNRVRIIRLDSNRGAAAARNVGAGDARAEWIAFLDSDDVWPPGSLAPRLHVAREVGCARVIWCGAFVDVRDGTPVATRTPRASIDLADFASGCWSCPGSTALMSRASWEASGGQDDALRRLEDYEWLLRWVMAGGELRVHPDVAAEVHRGRGASVSVVERAAARILLKHHQGMSQPLLKRMKSYLALEIAVARLRSGRMLGGLAALSYSWLLHPRIQHSLEPFWRTSERGRRARAVTASAA